MPRRPNRNVPTVILHGWQGSGPDHWQSWLAGQLGEAGREVRYPDLPDTDAPHLDAWLHALRASLTGLPEDGFDVVAHSLGAVLWLHHLATPNDAPRAARVALIAPPSPATTITEMAEFFPPPLDIDLVRHGAGEGTVFVGGDDDSYTPEGLGAAYGLPLKIATTIIAGGGHLNPESGYGEWPAVLSWCNRDNLAFY
ncbi:MAG: RBBP9/YdeN family alpha/beta hydrolase [Jatrophihabitantaceae bacterium]